jgi:hypothetical protein
MMMHPLKQCFLCSDHNDLMSQKKQAHALSAGMHFLGPCPKSTRYLLSVIHEAASYEKCEFSKPSVKFLGQIIDSSGCRVDPDKVKAIVEMKRPDDISGIRRFLGMVNQLNKLLSNGTKGYWSVSNLNLDPIK